MSRLDATLVVAGFVLWLDRATAWLSPDRRRNLYKVVVGITGLLVGAGLVDAATAATVVGHIIGVLEGVSLLLATIKARSGRRRAIYALGAVVLGVLKWLGIVNDGQVSHFLELGGHVLGLIPLLLALAKTDTRTVTGEPYEEYRARHGLRPASHPGAGDVVIVRDEPYPPSP